MIFFIKPLKKLEKDKGIFFFYMKFFYQNLKKSG